MILDKAWREARTAKRKRRIGALRPKLAEGGQERGSVQRPGRVKTNPARTYVSGDDGDGYCNQHTDWLTQTAEVYRMLEATAAYGSEQTLSIYGYRVAFLAGEGIRVAADTPKLQEWIEGWLRVQGMNGRMLTDAVGDSEVVGQVLWTMDDQGMLTCWPSFIGYEGYDGHYLGPQSFTSDWQQPVWWPTFEGTRLTGIRQRDQGHNWQPWLEVGRDRFVYIRTGGHGNVARNPSPTTKLGAVIDSVKNYDRAVREARILNNETTRQSPTFELHPVNDGADEQELAEYYEGLADRGWAPGDPVITRGKFHIESSSSAPVETVSSEVAMIVKDLSAVTGVPPHWLGYTDLLANRATANSLFEAIAASTHIERLSWEQGIDEMVRMARMVLGGPAGEFTVTMPLLSFQQFAMRSEALIALKKEGVIGADDVRGQLPWDAQGPDADDEAMRQRDAQMGPRLVREGNGR